MNHTEFNNSAVNKVCKKCGKIITKYFIDFPDQCTDCFLEKKPIKTGWECPKCKAVMAPWVNVCVHCHGNNFKCKEDERVIFSSGDRIVTQKIKEIVEDGIRDRSLYIPDSSGAMNEGGSTK